ncbi:HD domain-containing protein [Polaribacter sp.]|nr:HD domain-containing protein [Polaribacter sp.]
MQENIQTIYQKTISFAAQKHGSQKMPTGLPYVVHLSNVAMEVFMTHKKEPNFNIELAIQLALLHDVLEDTPLSFKELEDTFGNIVATGVLALTKNASLDKKYQMQDSLARIVKQGKEVAIVKLCDRITNLQKPPLKWDKEKIKKYHLQAFTIAQALEGKNAYLDNRILGEIKAYTAFF